MSSIARGTCSGLLFLAAVVEAQSQRVPGTASTPLTPNTGGTQCTISAEEFRRLIELPYDKFDQDQNDGFRPLALKHCELTAAMLLDSYVVNAASRMTELNRQALLFHAGQLYAYSGLREVAATRFRQSLDPHQNLESDLDWNAYVLASVAFEENDRPGLLREREALATAKQSEGNVINLRVVDGLIRCFSQPYVVAYETCRPRLSDAPSR